jgi:hypothetical protein
LTFENKNEDSNEVQRNNTRMPSGMYIPTTSSTAELNSIFFRQQEIFSYLDLELREMDFLFVHLCDG